MNLELERLAAALDGKKSRQGYMCKCPAHDDATASLSLDDGDKGIVFHCHAGCSQDAVLDQLKRRGLWMNGTPSRSLDKIAPRKIAPRKIDNKGLHGIGEVVAEYVYKNEKRTPVLKVLRYEPTNDGRKPFKQQQPDGRGGWKYGAAGVLPVPYKLPEALAAIKDGETIYIVEGEKDVGSLRQIGLTATTNAGGAGKWTAAHAAYLKGAKVAILPCWRILRMLIRRSWTRSATGGNPMDKARAAPRCGAKTRRGTVCRAPAIKGKRRCKFHGGLSTGAPKGNLNGFRHGRYTAAGKLERRRAREMIRELRALMAQLK